MNDSQAPVDRRDAEELAEALDVIRTQTGERWARLLAEAALSRFRSRYPKP